jgi:cytochrome b561
VALHWLVAALAAGVVGLGWAVLAAPANTPTGDLLVRWHRSVGLVILLAMQLRLLWRWWRRPPPLPQSVPPLTAALARATHRALDALLIAMPLAGYVNAAAAGHAVSVFGLVSLPPLLPENLRLSQAAIAVHLAGQYLFYFFLLLHIAGALHHAILRGDGVFERMVPFWPAAVRAAAAIIPVRRRAR